MLKLSGRARRIETGSGLGSHRIHAFWHYRGGTGSTANCFINELTKNYAQDRRCRCHLRSDRATLEKPLHLGAGSEQRRWIASLHIDSADEITTHLHMPKGGEEALTREMIITACSKKFVCIADSSKQVGVLDRPT